MLATTVAWDTSLSWTWAMAIDALQATMCQVLIFGLHNEQILGVCLLHHPVYAFFNEAGFCHCRKVAERSS